MDELTAQSRQRIGGLLRQYRTDAGLSLQDLATATQYSKSAIHKVEQGRGDLTVEMAKEVDRMLATGGRFVAVLGEPKFFRPAQLPAISHLAVGMDAEVRQMEGWLYQAEQATDGPARRVMLVTGPPWIGTSTLTLRVAHSVTAVGLFPDGQLYADLAGFRQDHGPRDPGEVLASFLRALGAWVAPGASLGELTQQYRTALAGREMLIVLDNAASAEQIAPLLPGPSATGCRVLVASRLSLANLTTSVADRIEAGPLPQSHLEGLLTRLLSLDHPITRQPGAVARLAAGAAGFPSVITMTAGWLADNPDFPIMSGAAYEEAVFTQSDASPLRVALDASYRHVSPGAQRLFRLITVWPNKAISVAAAAQLLGASETEASTCLAELAAANLVRADRARGRYHQLPLLCRYGMFLSTMHDTAGDRVAARDRLLSWYLQTAIATERAVAADGAWLAATRQRSEPLTPDARFPTSTAALDWIRAEGENLVAVVRAAVAAGQHRLAWQFALACRAGLDAAAAASSQRWGALWRDVFEAAGPAEPASRTPYPKWTSGEPQRTVGARARCV